MLFNYINIKIFNFSFYNITEKFEEKFIIKRLRYKIVTLFIIILHVYFCSTTDYMYKNCTHLHFWLIKNYFGYNSQCLFNK